MSRLHCLYGLVSYDAISFTLTVSFVTHTMALKCRFPVSYRGVQKS